MKSLLVLLLRKNIYENTKQNIKNTIEPSKVPSIEKLTEEPSSLERSSLKRTT